MLYKKFTSFDGKIYKCDKNMLEVQHISVLGNSLVQDPEKYARGSAHVSVKKQLLSGSGLRFWPDPDSMNVDPQRWREYDQNVNILST